MDPSFYLLSFPDVPYEDVLAGGHGDVPPLLPPAQCHVGDVGFLAADHTEHSAGHIAQVLLGQPHDPASLDDHLFWVKANKNTYHKTLYINHGTEMHVLQQHSSQPDIYI